MAPAECGYGATSSPASAHRASAQCRQSLAPPATQSRAHRGHTDSAVPPRPHDSSRHGAWQPARHARAPPRPSCLGCGTRHQPRIWRRPAALLPYISIATTRSQEARVRRLLVRAGWRPPNFFTRTKIASEDYNARLHGLPRIARPHPHVFAARAREEGVRDDAATTTSRPSHRLRQHAGREPPPGDGSPEAAETAAAMAAPLACGSAIEGGIRCAHANHPSTSRRALGERECDAAALFGPRRARVVRPGAARDGPHTRGALAAP